MTARDRWPALARFATQGLRDSYTRRDAEAALAEIDRLTHHSVLLNEISYLIAVALGKVTPPADYHGSVVTDLGELLTLNAATQLGNREQLHLIRDLIAADAHYAGDDCYFCRAGVAAGHSPGCAWVRAKKAID